MFYNFFSSISQDSNPQLSDQKFHLIPTTSRVSSISDQIHSFDLRINNLSNQKSPREISNENKMDTSDTNILLPWKNSNECEQLLKCLVNKNFDSIKRRQLLIQLQWLTNISDEYRSQLFQAMLTCCESIGKEEFLRNFSQQFNTSLVLLSIFMRNKLSYDHCMKLINVLDTYDVQDKSIFRMKIKELQRMIDQTEQLRTPIKTNQVSTADEQIQKYLTINNMLDMFGSYDSISDCRIEKQFYKYFKSNNQYEDECKRLLMNVLVQAEYRLSEPTIGMILDQLEKMDYKSSR
jgi:hypothetical protein